MVAGSVVLIADVSVERHRGDTERRGQAADGDLLFAIGGGHPQRDRVVAKLFVENLERFLDGKPLKEVVDRAAGY